MDGERMVTPDSQPGEETWRRRFFDFITFFQSFSWYDDHTDFYNGVASSLRRVANADNANIRLLTPARDSFVLYASDGDVASTRNWEYGTLSVIEGRMPRLIETGEPFVFDFRSPQNDDVDWQCGTEDGYTQAVIVALWGQQGLLGAIDFLYREPREWSEDDIEWLREVGRFAGAIVGNALLTDNMISLRVANERRNLASEIHDNLAQSVNLISIEADNAIDSLEQGDMEALRHGIDLIGRAAAEAQKAVRGEVENLRAEVEAQEDMSMGEFARGIQAFCQQWGLSCEVECDETARETLVAKRVMTQLRRAVNEALVNVVRHARATEVTVSYSVSEGRLALNIADDGCGFSLENVPPSHMGLRIMRERLESVGAQLNIDSVPEKGTRVSIDVPYLA